MADPLPPDSGDDTAAAERDSTAGTPRWVKVFAIVGLALALLIAVLLVVGGGHGPGRHTWSGHVDAAGVTARSGR